MKYFTKLLSIVLMMVLSACDRYVEVEMPIHIPQFVINASLEPGQPVQVFVTQTRGALEPSEFSPVRDATVEIIEDGEKSYPLTFKSLSPDDRFLNGYTSEDLEIKSGKTYEIIASGRFETAWSKVTVPSPIEIKSVEMRQGTNSEAEFAVVFDDPEEQNFYELSMYFRGIEVNFTGHSGLRPLNPVYQDNSHRGNLLINDRLFNGREAKIEFTGYLPSQIELEVTIYLKHVSKEHYEYHKTLGLQRYTEYDPFAQPVQIYNNVENGRGIVMAGATAVYATKFKY